MERLDVLFANRYLTALDQWKNQLSPSGCWKVALDVTHRSSLLVLQHLLLGMNAHINLDLGVATVEVMQGQPIDGIQNDFDAINTIIGSLTNEVIHEISRVSPLLSLLGLHANRSDLLLIQFSMDNARGRGAATPLQHDLSKTTGQANAACNIATPGQGHITQLAGTIFRTTGFIRFHHLGHSSLPSGRTRVKIIRVLNSYTKTFMKASHFPTHHLSRKIRRFLASGRSFALFSPLRVISCVAPG